MIREEESKEEVCVCKNNTVSRNRCSEPPELVLQWVFNCLMNHSLHYASNNL